MSKTPRERRHIERYFDFEDKVSAVNYYVDTILNKTLTMFRYENLPDTLPERELELLLQTVGKCIVTEWEGDLIALDGNYAPANDVYYRPTHFIVANPWAKINEEFKLVNCDVLAKTEVDREYPEAILFRGDPLDRGLLPIIHKYGAMLTEVDLTQYLAAINFRSIYAITANTDREYESAKAFLTGIKDGKQGVMMEEEMSNGIKTQPYANSSQGYITQTIELRQYVWGMLLNELGLNANYNMKRERLSASETDLNEDSLRPLIDTMLEERQKAVYEINKKYGTDISVEFNSAWEKYNEDEIMESDDSDMVDTEDVQTEEESQPIEIRSDEETVEETPAEAEDVEVEETEDTEEEVQEEPEEETPEEEPEQPAVDIEINIDTAEEVSVEEADETPEPEEEETSEDDEEQEETSEDEDEDEDEEDDKDED